MGVEPEPHEEPDTSEGLDLVAVFFSDEHDAQTKVQVVRGLLEAGGVPAFIVGNTALPNLPFEVRVPRARLEEARFLIAESEAAGVSGAEEAERSSEGPA
jgi:hypothetical protein